MLEQLDTHWKKRKDSKEGREEKEKEKEKKKVTLDLTFISHTKIN